MIFENEQEKEAFEFIYELVSEETSRKGCNDLPKEVRGKFEGLTVPTDDGGKEVQRPITFDFDVCYWLKLQIRKGKQ